MRDQGKLISRKMRDQGKLSLMKCYLYILKCKDKSYYTGITWNPEKRLYQHNQGIKSSLQNSKKPVEIVYLEKFNSRKEAAKQEKKVKGWTRIKKKNLINQFKTKRVYIER